MPTNQPFLQILSDRLNLSEFKTLCQDLDIDFDNLAGETKIIKMNSLNGMVGQERIISELQSSRPDINWPTEINNIFSKESILASKERERLLKKVQKGWINGVLKKSLDKQVELELGLEYDFNLPGTVADRQVVEAGMGIGEVFDEVGGQLLILGEPGSGKTTTLLKLAEYLLRRAKANENEPIPLILNLSIWSPKLPKENNRFWRFDKYSPTKAKQKPFEQWLGKICFDQYTIEPEKTFKMLKSGKIVLLLDALDEVQVGVREKCLQAINECGIPQIVVTSRVRDYEAIKSKLHIMTWVHILPLTDIHIDNFLSQKEDLMLLKNAVESDHEIKSLARTPLMLGIMASAFENAAKSEVEQLKTNLDKVDFIFSKYIDQMFVRHSFENEADARHWLACLADMMNKNDQTTFNIKGIHPGWIPSKKRILRFHKIVDLIGMIYFGLIFGLIGKVSGEISGELSGELNVGIDIGLIVGLVFGLFVALFVKFSKYGRFLLIAEWRWSPPSFADFWAIFQSRIFVAFVSGLASGLIFGLISGFMGLLIGETTFGFYLAAIGGPIFGLIFSLIFSLYTVLIICIKGRSIRHVYESKDTISKTISNAFLSESFFFGLIGTPIFMLFYGLYNGPIYGLLLALVGGAIGSLEILVKHFCVRHMLNREGYLPYPMWWQDGRLTEFLGEMKDRILLQRVDNQNWRFIHKSLQDHFSTQSSILWENNRITVQDKGKFVNRFYET